MLVATLVFGLAAIATGYGWPMFLGGVIPFALITAGFSLADR